MISYYQTGMSIPEGREGSVAELPSQKERRVGMLLVAIKDRSLDHRIVLIHPLRMQQKTYYKAAGRYPVTTSPTLWVAFVCSVYVWVHPGSGVGYATFPEDRSKIGWRALWDSEARTWEDCVSKAQRVLREMVMRREFSWAGTGTEYSVYAVPKGQRVRDWNDMHDLALDAVWSAMSKLYPNEAVLAELSV